MLSVCCSVCEDGKWKVCEGAVLPVLLKLLQDKDVEVQANAAGVVMYTVIITRGTTPALPLLEYKDRYLWNKT